MSEIDRYLPAVIQHTGRELSLPSRALALLEERTQSGSFAEGTPISEYPKDAIFVKILVDNTHSLNRKFNSDLGRMVDTFSEDPGSNAVAVREGQNKVLDAVAGTSYADRLYASTEVFCSPFGSLGDLVIDPFHPLAEAVRLDANNFNVCGMETPLYRRTTSVVLDTLIHAGLISVGANNKGWGKPKSATFIITDGGDNCSTAEEQEECKELITRASSTNVANHFISLVGISDGAVINGKERFFDTAEKMGIPENLVITAGSTPAEIAAMMDKVIGLIDRIALADKRQLLLLKAGGYDTAN